MAKIERNGFVYGSDNSKDIKFDKTVKNELSAENVQDAIDEINSSLYIAGDNKNITFGKNGDGDYGYYKADGSFSPFKSGEGGEPPVLLWENPNPNVTFAAQTVPLDLSKYAGVLIEITDSSTIYHTTGYIKVGEEGAIGTTDNYSPWEGGMGRSVAVTSTGVTFRTAYSGTSAANHHCIPYKIYGVKGVVVEPLNPISEVVTFGYSGGNSLNINNGVNTVLSGNNTIDTEHLHYSAGFLTAKVTFTCKQNIDGAISEKTYSEGEQVAVTGVNINRTLII